MNAVYDKHEVETENHVDDINNDGGHVTNDEGNSKTDFAHDNDFRMWMLLMINIKLRKAFILMMNTTMMTEMLLMMINMNIIIEV